MDRITVSTPILESLLDSVSDYLDYQIDGDIKQTKLAGKIDFLCEYLKKEMGSQQPAIALPRLD